MHTQDKASRPLFRDRRDKSAPALLHALCEQALPLIPASVHANTLSISTHVAVWLTALLGAISPHLSAWNRTLALLGAGFGAFGVAFGECLQTMRTTQRDELSASLRDWLNALAVPISCAGITAACDLPTWAIVLVNVTACTTYNAQLVLYHHTGKSVRAQTLSSADTPLLLAAAYGGLAVARCWIDKHSAWAEMALAGAAIAVTFLQLRGNMAYFPKLGRWSREHLWFIGLCSVLGVLYVAGAIKLHDFLLCCVFASFRISGTYALRATVKVPFDGKDLGLLAFAIAIAISHRFGLALSDATPLTHWLAVGACLYALVRNVIDFSNHYPVQLKALSP